MIYEKYLNIYNNAITYFTSLPQHYDISYLNKLINNASIYEKIQLLLGKGLCDEQAISLLTNMPYLLILNKMSLDNEICCIYNSDVLYAIVLLNDNSYSWCCYDNEKNTFLNAHTKAFKMNTIEITEDSIIRAIIDSTFREDIIKYAKIKQEDNLEIRIQKLKRIKLNSNGYKIK